MNTSPDVSAGSVIRRPTWKRLWDWFSRAMPRPVITTAIPIKILTRPASKKPRVAVPVKPAYLNAPVSAKGVGVWQVYAIKGNPDTTPIQVVHSGKRLFGVVFQSPEGWLFWAGPKKKVFTPPGRGEIWTTPDPKIAIVVANFIHSSRLSGLPPKEIPKRR